jgi:polyisoprenoid-binding protein YceI
MFIIKKMLALRTMILRALLLLCAKINQHSMKHTLVLLGAAAVLFASCQGNPKGDEAKTTEAQAPAVATGAAYKPDLAQSHVDFTGTKPTGEHHGQFMLKGGEIKAEGGKVTGGTLEIDMNSLKITDKDTNGSYKLAGHLRTDAFFDVAKFPTSKFVITSIREGVDSAARKDLVMKDATHMVSGNLTLKDSTKEVTFPAKIVMTDAGLTTDANFNIDRTQWGLVYGNDKGLGDKFIRPIVNIQLHVVANK